MDVDDGDSVFQSFISQFESPQKMFDWLAECSCKLTGLNESDWFHLLSQSKNGPSIDQEGHGDGDEVVFNQNDYRDTQLSQNATCKTVEALTDHLYCLPIN